MKIATNVHRDNFGGITISNLALFDWLEKQKETIVGIEIISARHILGPIIFRHYCPDFFKHHIINGLDILPRFSWEKIGNPRKKWRDIIEIVKDILRKEDVDVMLLNGTYNSPWILGVAAHELGIPIVLRYAGVLQMEVTEKNFFTRQRLLNYEKWLAQSAASIIFPSKLCKDTVEREITKEPIKNCTIIANPVTKSNGTRSKNKGRYKIATIGRWTQVKNFQSFINIHKELLLEDWPHKAIMITSFKDKKFIIPETIECRLPMSHEDLLMFYKSVDLVVVTSHFETFSNVAAEALVHGASVLVSKNVGFSEILRKAGLSRMIIDSFEDPKKVAQVIKKLSKKKITTKEINRVSSLLDSQKIHQQIIKVINNVLKTK